MCELAKFELNEAFSAKNTVSLAYEWLTKSRLYLVSVHFQLGFLFECNFINSPWLLRLFSCIKQDSNNSYIHIIINNNNNTIYIKAARERKPSILK